MSAAWRNRAGLEFGGLGLDVGGDVAGGHDAPPDGRVGQPVGEDEVEVAPAAVAVPAPDQDWRAGRPRGQGPERLEEAGDIVGVHQVERGAADELVGPVAEDGLDRGADPRDGPAGVPDADDTPRVLAEHGRLRAGRPGDAVCRRALPPVGHERRCGPPPRPVLVNGPTSQR